MPAGRPTKCTRARIKKVCKAIEQGNYAVVAAQLAGIGEVTYYEWLKRGESRPGTIFAEFRKSLKESEAKAEDMLLQRVRTAAVTDGQQWQAFMTILERRFRSRWARDVAAPASPINIYTDHKAADWYKANHKAHFGFDPEDHKGKASDSIEMPEAAEETQP